MDSGLARGANAPPPGPEGTEMTGRARRIAGSIALGFAAPTLALGWGNDGHRIVGEIAWHHLTPEAKREVRQLLEPGRYGTLAETCTWADTYARARDEYDWVAPFHYINVDRSAERVEATRDNCRKDACVIGGIRRFGRQLRDGDASHATRVNALRFLGHFVGDVHQPLHVSHFDGRGGTLTTPRFASDDRRHVHAIWDDVLISRHLERLGADWKTYAGELRLGITERQRGDWGLVLDPVEWANESLAIAKRDDLFRFGNGERLPDGYSGDAMPVISERLRQAGIRLAALLNRIFAPDGGELPF